MFNGGIPSLTLLSNCRNTYSWPQTAQEVIGEFAKNFNLLMSIQTGGTYSLSTPVILDLSVIKTTKYSFIKEGLEG